jgi:2-alkyl-3-oxoalkanoate reductase
MRETVNALLAAAGAPPVTRTIPFAVAYAAGIACEGLWHALPLRGEPPMTRFLAEQLATSHWYDMAPARRDFGYAPRVSFDEGLRRLSRAWSSPGP